MKDSSVSFSPLVIYEVWTDNGMAYEDYDQYIIGRYLSIESAKRKQERETTRNKVDGDWLDFEPRVTITEVEVYP